MHSLKILWNPLEGIDLGFFTIHFYSLSYVVAFILGWYIIKPIFKRDNIDFSKLDPLFMYTVIGCLAGARIGHYLFYETSVFWTNPARVFLPFTFEPEFEWTGFAGMASHGAAIGIIIAMFFYSRKHLKKHMFFILDRIVIPTAIGGTCVRLGNLINSEIVGKITNVDWAFKFLRNSDDLNKYEAMRLTGLKNADDAYNAIASNLRYSEVLESIPYRHPTQLYEAICYVGVFIILFLTYWKTEKRHKLGYLLGMFFVLLFSVRLFIEQFKVAQIDGREDFFLGMNTGQLLSIPFILIGLFLMYSPKGLFKNPVD